MSDKIIYVGPSLMSILFVLFLTLKLTGVIAWSWWLVTMPLWIGFAIFIIILLIILFVTLIALGIGLILNK